MTNPYHRAALVFIGLVLQLWMGCATPLADEWESQTDAGTVVPADAVDPGDDDGLSLLTNTPELLVGTYTQATGRLGFELSHTGDERVAAIYGADGALIARMTFDSDHETLQLGTELILEGGPGSLSSGPEPEWDAATLSENTSHLAQLSASAEFQLLGSLGKALAARKDIDRSLLPPLSSYGQSPSDAPTESGLPDGAAVGKVTQALSPFAPNCIICMAGCTAASAACGQAMGWVASFVCAGPSTICYAGCIATVCQ